MLITVLAGEARPRFQRILQCLLSVRVHDINAAAFIRVITVLFFKISLYKNIVRGIVNACLNNPVTQ
jgi:hypothetical protein